MQSRIILLLVASAIASVWCHGQEDTNKINGGSEASRGTYFWQVSIQSYRFGHKCGGAIISDRWVLTSASCLKIIRRKEWRVYADTIDLENPGSIHTVKTTVYHPEYEQNHYADLALIQVEPAFKWGYNLGPLYMSTSPVLDFGEGYISGWGPTSLGGPDSKILRGVKLSVYNIDLCKEEYAKDNIVITEDKFCAIDPNNSTASACGSDVGGAFVLNALITGVISYPNICTLNARPTVLTDVSYHRDWIRSVSGW